MSPAKIEVKVGKGGPLELYCWACAALLAKGFPNNHEGRMALNPIKGKHVEIYHSRQRGFHAATQLEVRETKGQETKLY